MNFNQNTCQMMGVLFMLRYCSGKENIYGIYNEEEYSK